MHLFVLFALLSDCGDQAFVDRALTTWTRVRAELKVADAPLPRMIFFNGRCGDQVELPDGTKLPARLMTFAGSHEGKPFLVFALPELWRKEERHRNNPHLDTGMRAVFVHEMTHTVQTRGFGDRLGELEKQHAIKDLDDDIVQTRFESNAEFAAMVKKERELLYAVSTPQQAREVLRQVRARHAKFFTGENAYLAELEEIWLGMEGAAQWAAYRAARLDGLSHEEAVTLVSGRAKRWSQDEGLALFLTIDRLVPGWQKRAFAAKPETAEALLARAAR